MEFRVLGPLELCEGGEVRRLGSPKQRALLAALLVEPGMLVTTDRLIDLLWDEKPPPSARNSLQTYVARLRRELARLGGVERLVTRGSGYALEIEPEQVDAVRFERLLSRARASLDPAGTVALLDEALALWRGPAFAELAELEAVRGASLRMEELRLAALHARVDARLELGQVTEAIADLEDAVVAQPLRERPHEQLVRALAAAGRPAEALEVAREFRARLTDEVGLDPSPRLTALELDVLRQAPGMTPAPDEPTPTPPVGDRLVGRATSLVGRDGELDELQQALGRARLVTVTGPGGVGKTRLAMEAIRQRAACQRTDGRLCELGPLEDGAALAHAVATATGLVPQPGQPVDQATVVEALRDRGLVVVLDSCEHLLDAVAPFADAVLRRCPGVTLLATSRERLGVEGERIVALGPLAVPSAGDPDVAGAAAVRLFVDRARDVRPGFALSADNAEAVAEVCRRLDGLPLAVELAAARTGALEPSDLAARLDERFALLESARRTGEPRHRTLRAVVDWSFQLLDETERRVFERVSVFAGGFTLSLAEHVAAGGGVARERVAALVAGLVDKSMIVVSHPPAPHPAASARYTLLETLRDYGQKRLADRGETADVARAHARAMVDLAERAAAGLSTRAEGEWVAQLDDELDNFRATHRWALADSDPGLALRLTAALHRYSHWRLRREMFDWAEAAVAVPGAAGHPALPGACAGAGVAAWMRGDLDAAEAHALRGLRAAGEDAEVTARLWEVAGDIATFRGRLDEAGARFAEAGRLADRAGDPQTGVVALVSQALVCAYGGDTRQGLALATVAHERATRSRNPTALAWGRYTRGEVLGIEDPRRALPLLEDARQLADSVGNEFVVGIAEVSAASLRSRLGDPAEALGGFAALIDRWRRSDNWTQQWTTLRNLVELMVRLGADEPAAVLHGAATAPEAGGRSYGAEAARLRTAAATAQERLGAQRYETASERGRSLTTEEVLELATETLERLRAVQPAQPSSID